MRPLNTWLITAGGLALLLGAMAWTTWSLLGMERTRHRMDGEAQVQERARLALWRMESVASAVVVEESARPPEHYRAFRGDGTASPLLTSPPSRVLLHFEMDADGRVRSPQAPEAGDLDAARRLEVAEDLLRTNGGRLAELRGILGEKADTAVGGTARAVRTNVAVLQDVNNTPAPAPMAVGTDAPGAPEAAEYANFDPPQVAQRPAEAQASQELWNSREALRRSQVVELAKGNNALKPAAPVTKGKELAARKKKEQKEAEDVRRELAAGGMAEAKAATITPATAAAPAAVAPGPAMALDALLPGDAEARGDAAAADGLNQTAPRLAPVETVSDFRPVWIRDALLLTRRATSPAGVVEQGAWLDWPGLRAELLRTVSDLFPHADLTPAAAGDTNGASLLASLPVRFLPGALELPPAPRWTPLRLSLAIAWLCVLTAAGAVLAVVRGMMILSERRASFVSSVTHELRTPLATFKLYSEMLADGMVRDPQKRQRYLETLTTEADRLGHLVENVLSYSRLEGGKGPSGRAKTTAGELLGRIVPRLRQRAAQADGTLEVVEPEGMAAVSLETDAAAVEQIVFNLVDNACKYGRAADAPPEITVSLFRHPGGALVISVCDLGPGIAPGEVKKLFRPFHKSAREAAHTAPGVGLGLALCRRLAVELGGRLEIDLRRERGACFQLQLPT